MSIFQLATVLIYVTSVLTSTVNQSSEPDQNPSLALKKLFGSSLTGTKDPTLLTDTKFISELDTPKSIITEGGPVPNFRKEETKSSTQPHLLNTKIPDKIISESKESPKQSPIVPRKGVDEGKKIVGRKGVEFLKVLSDNEKLDTSDEATIPAKTILDPLKTLTEISVDKKEQIPPVIDKTEVKSSSNDIKLDNSTNVIGKKTSNATVIYVSSHPNDMTSHKRKPTSTTGEGDDDGKGMPSSPTQTEIGMPRKVDYIIPVVITIMATPVLGIAAFILYTRGRDCWDKRHYRRMDFLIEGMYND